MKDTIKPSYVPEVDEGKKLCGASCMSTNVWLPLKNLKNPEAILRATRFSYVNPKTGTESVVAVSKKVGDYLVVAREFLPEQDVLGISDAMHRPKIAYSEFGFTDTIRPRNTE